MAVDRRPRAAHAGAVRGIGRAILRYRKEAGLTQTDLANRAGVTQSEISYWERGEREPSLHDVQRLEVALGVPRRGALLLAAGIVEVRSDIEDAIDADPKLNVTGKESVRQMYRTMLTYSSTDAT